MTDSKACVYVSGLGETTGLFVMGYSLAIVVSERAYATMSHQSYESRRYFDVIVFVVMRMTSF